MTAPALVLATALSAAGAGQPAQPTRQFKPSKPLFSVPPLQQPDTRPPRRENPPAGEPLVCHRMPVIAGSNSVDPEFVHETPKDVDYTMRRVPGIVRPCPKRSGGEK
jgi:hypothetical protein